MRWTRRYLPLGAPAERTRILSNKFILNEEGAVLAKHTKWRIATLNVGSSSIKMAIYETGAEERCEMSGSLARIGLPGSRFVVRTGTGTLLRDETLPQTGMQEALALVFRTIQEFVHNRPLDALGHRLVHGGTRYSAPVVITKALIQDLKELIPLAPMHLPAELAGIEAARNVFPYLRQTASFDTAFHANRPAVAQLYGLAQRWQEEGIRRYGFHGLSCQFILEELAQVAPAEAQGRILIAHLGNGASITAVAGGAAMDTTMGFTPVSGLVMGSRSGDLDPGAVTFLMRHHGLSCTAVDELLASQSGLLGVSGLSSDLRDLLEREAQEPRAALALSLFTYRARLALASMVAAAQGIDTLIFTAGIGEHSPAIRERIVSGLAYLGLAIDPLRNQQSASVISPAGAAVTVRVLATNEERMIARQAASLCLHGSGQA